MLLVKFNNDSLVRHVDRDVLEGLLVLGERLLHALVAELVGVIIARSFLARSQRDAKGVGSKRFSYLLRGRR